jgi:hypothetical protein
LAKTRSREVGKEEGLWIGLPVKDRSAKGDAKLVLPERRFNGGCIEIIPGIQRGVAEKLKDISVIFVRAGLEEQVDGAAIAAPIPRVGVGNVLGEFLNRLDGRKDLRGKAVVIVVIADAVEQQTIFLIAKAVEGEGCVAALHGIRDAGYLLLRRQSARTEANQFGEVAAIQR